VPVPASRATPPRRRIVPPERTRYLGDIADGARNYPAWARAQADLAHKAQVLREAGELVKDTKLAARSPAGLSPENAAILGGWDAFLEKYRNETFTYEVRGQQIHQPMVTESLSHLKIRRVATPTYRDDGDRLLWRLPEHGPA